MIRMATPADIDIIQYLGERQIAEMTDYQPIPDRETTLNLLRLNGEGAIIYVAFRNDKPVGWIGGYTDRSYYDTQRFAIINPIYVVPEARGGIYAVSLLAAFEEWAATQNATHSTIGIGTKLEAESAARLLAACGYEEAETVYAKELE